MKTVSLKITDSYDHESSFQVQLCIPVSRLMLFDTSCCISGRCNAEQDISLPAEFTVQRIKCLDAKSLYFEITQ